MYNGNMETYILENLNKNVCTSIYSLPVTEYLYTFLKPNNFDIKAI